MADEIDDAYLSKLATPIIEREPAFPELMASRIAEMRLLMPEWDTYMLRSDPINRICRHAAYGDLLYYQELNEGFRATLRDFAKDADLTAKAGDWGLERYLGEDDDSLSRRLDEEMKGFAAMGSDSWYASNAFKASPERVADVAVNGDGKGNVFVAVLAKDNGGLAVPDLLSIVSTRLNLVGIKGTNDTIHVQPAVISEVDLAFDYWLLPDAPPDTSERADRAVRAAFAKERRLGWDFVTEWAGAKLFVEGMRKVTVTAPSAAVATPFNQAVALHYVTPNYRGRQL